MRQLGHKFIKDKQLYAMLVLPLLYIIIFCYVPMTGIVIAFKKFDFNLGIWGSPWIGFDNFEDFFSSYMFGRLIRNTIQLAVYGIIAGFPVPIILALSLNSIQAVRFKKIVQTVTYLPHFISTVIIVGILIQLFNPVVGLYGAIGRLISGGTPADLLGQANVFPHLFVWSGVWQEMGFGAIIYMAALSAVDVQLYDSAHMDGASRLRCIWHIDIPSILPTVVVLLILRMGSIMNIGFEKVFLMQNPLNGRTSEVISTYVYKVALLADGAHDFSYSTAIGLFNSVIGLFMIVLVNYASKKIAQSSLW